MHKTIDTPHPKELHTHTHTKRQKERDHIPHANKVLAQLDDRRNHQHKLQKINTTLSTMY